MTPRNLHRRGPSMSALVASWDVNQVSVSTHTSRRVRIAKARTSAMEEDRPPTLSRPTAIYRPSVGPEAPLAAPAGGAGDAAPPKVVADVGWAAAAMGCEVGVRDRGPLCMREGTVADAAAPRPVKREVDAARAGRSRSTAGEDVSTAANDADGVGGASIEPRDWEVMAWAARTDARRMGGRPIDDVECGGKLVGIAVSADRGEGGGLSVTFPVVWGGGRRGAWEVPDSPGRGNWRCDGG